MATTIAYGVVSGPSNRDDASNRLTAEAAPARCHVLSNLGAPRGRVPSCNSGVATS